MSDYSGILDVAIGMVFVYLLLSLLCSAVTEIVEAFWKKRGTNLFRGLSELFCQDRAFVEQLYNDPLIFGLYQGALPSARMDDGGAAKLPSYIPSRNFALALINQFLGGQSLSVANLKAGIKSAVIPDPLKGTLLLLVDAANNDIEAAIRNIEEWYNSATDRVSGWYKRHTQLVSLAVGMAIAFFGNVDSISLTQSLANDAALRGALVASAGQYAATASSPAGSGANAVQSPGRENPKDEAVCVKAPDSWKCKEFQACRLPDSADCRYYANLTQLQSLGLPIGWKTGDPRTVFPGGFWDWFNKFIGLFLTGIAISFGAPFWFDTLNKFMRFRSAVKPESKTESKPAPTK